MSDDLYFEVITPLGFQVRVTHSYWQLIVTVKHPVMAGRDEDVKVALQQPDEVRVSRSDPNVYLFYKAERDKRWVQGCSVLRKIEKQGFLW